MELTTQPRVGAQRSNPGLKLANAFGVNGLKLVNAFGVTGLKLVNAFGVNQPNSRLITKPVK
jgi:hypothetical protein